MFCSQCGLAVTVINGQTITACNCNAAVVANMSAVAKGVGSTKVVPPKVEAPSNAVG
jgi:hypothetical protein